MFRIFLLGLISIFTCMSFVPAFADCGPADTSNPGDFLKGCADSSGDLAVPVTGGTDRDGVKKLVQTVAVKVLQFGALFAIGAIVFSGIRYTTSAGDDEKLKSAKNTAIYALIGLVLLLMAFPLVDILVNFIYTLGQQQ